MYVYGVIDVVVIDTTHMRSGSGDAIWDEHYLTLTLTLTLIGYLG